MVDCWIKGRTPFILQHLIGNLQDDELDEQ